VSVLVANGTETNGVAGQVTTFLGHAGYAVQKAVNAMTTVPGTMIYVPTGDTAAGKAVASELGLPSTIVQASSLAAPVPSGDNADVIVIVGPDLVPFSRSSSTSSAAASAVAPSGSTQPVLD